MDYKELKTKVDAAVKKPAEKVKELRKQIEKVKRQFQNEQDASKSLDRHIVKLKATAGEAITEGKKSFEKFKAAMRRLKTEAEVNNELIAQIQDEFLPKLQKELNDNLHSITDQLETTITQNCSVCAEALKPIALNVRAEIERYITERETFETALIGIYNENDVKQVFGFTPKERCQQFLPVAPTQAEIANFLSLLGIKRPPVVLPYVKPEIESPVVDEPVEKPIEPEPVVDESTKPNHFLRSCDGCSEEFQTLDSDAIFCPECQVKETERLELEKAEQQEAEAEKTRDFDTDQDEKVEPGAD